MKEFQNKLKLVNASVYNGNGVVFKTDLVMRLLGIILTITLENHLFFTTFALNRYEIREWLKKNAKIITSLLKK